MGKSKIGCSKHFLILVLIALPIIHFLITPNFERCGRSNPYADTSGCNIAVREATNAVEMYNMDSKIFMEELNKENIEILKKTTVFQTNKKYLEEKWPYNKGYDSRKKCEYISQGDLSGNGFIYCKYHGTPYYMTEKAKGNKNIAPPSKEYLKDEKDKSKEKLFSKYGILGGLMLFILLLIIF